jgi:hypothetical protein
MSENSQGSKSKLHFADFEGALAEALQQHAPDSTEIAKLRLFFFIKLASQSGWLTGLDYRQKKRHSKTLEEITYEMHNLGSESFPKTRLVAFQNAKNFGDLSFSDSFVRNLIWAIQKTTEYKNHHQMRRLWRDTFGAEPGYMPHLLQRLVRTESHTNNTRLEEHNTDLLYDYLLFRPDPDDLISTAFFRFYVHETHCIRSLGLRLDPRHQYLSSKGWLIKQDKGVLATGYIVDRSSSAGGVLMNGGVSSLFIDTSASNPISRRNEKDGQLMIASCFHFQATFEQEPSAARAVLVRIKGLENAGGLFSQNKRKRNKKTRDLQNLLSKRFGEGIDPDDCCAFLSKLSGLSVTHFEDIFGIRQDERYDLPDDTGPYMPWRPSDRHVDDQPRPNIFIDGSKPLNEN